MVTVKSSQKIFTDSEVSSLTGICVDLLAEDDQDLTQTPFVERRLALESVLCVGGTWFVKPGDGDLAVIGERARAAAALRPSPSH